MTSIAAKHLPADASVGHPLVADPITRLMQAR
jgi:hypothetical protein